MATARLSMPLNDRGISDYVVLYNVRMLFPSIETGTVMNARESENYLPISCSFSASK